ncbi:MAG: SusC/RagA family TonB-linked outer membrane protein [Candidatus Pedobacter colombiensis]|uniref:SusC/RagA family TonB-linked outer membrane protein n=1 Tax=Candidatus Pedobacter colombiensis TaxID=3121371 RepID=A0AAJ5W9H9_9SPHI|nr:SusC/RagA family TonB-linked outer membrane protein [Pedobacter sp.]WEK20150.1 MAG: SusC/RagA family TonB-linked outer membrane protein [Pedobacter sp.]
MKTFLYRSFCLFALTILVLGHSASLHAQQVVTVRGKVTDKKDKLGVIGASVIEVDQNKRTITGVSTDINGNFAIRISNTKHQLVVSYLSYKTFQAGVIGDRTVINVILEPSSNDLDEVVLTGKRMVNNGTGLNVAERNSTIASASISGKALEELAVSSIDQALAGRLSGVDFGTTSGDPGAGMSIRIRGTSSITGSAEPLIVLDGMPYETEIPADFNFGTADDQGYAQLLNIAPSDIKDITVLKDAASTAVWGSRAANGVLLINTKRGEKGKPVIAYNFKGTMARQPNPIPFLTGDQYSMLIPEAVMNATGLPLDFLGNNGQNKAFQYDPSDAYYYYNYSNNTDWVKLITRTGYTQDHNISMSGGGDKARYYASVGYLGQTGTTLGTDLSRITTKINLDYIVSSKLRFKTDLTYTHVDNNLNYSNSLRGIAFSKMPNMAPYEYDEYGNRTTAYFSPLSNIQGTFSINEKGEIKGTYNPLAMANEGASHLLGERITPKFNLQYDISSVLFSTVDVQFDINNTKSKTFLPQIATGQPSTETSVNRASDADGDSYNIQSKINLIYRPNLKNEKHNFQGLMSFQTNDTKSASYTVTTSNTASSELQDPSNPSVTNGTGLSLKSDQSQSRSVGLLLQGQYGFLDRYLINVNGRVDGNSKFSPDNRFGFFPGISTRWRISGESFMKKYTFIEDFSLRLSYGASGKAPGSNYAYFNNYTPFGWSYAGKPAVYPSNIGLAHLKWETVIGKNLGFNLWLFSSRIKIDAEIYQNTTKDMFYKDLKIAGTSGYSKIDMNIGTMNNDGWEIGINTTPIKTKRLIVGFDFNIARNVNSLQSISDFYPRESSIGLPGLGKYKSFLLLGNPFGSYYGFKYKGVYKDLDATIARDEKGNPIIGPNGQTVYMRYNYPTVDYTFQPGDAIYEDINHDGNIDEKDMVYLGNSVPKFTGGFGPSVTFNGNFKIQAFFSYRYGYDIVNIGKIATTNMYGVNNQSTAVLRRWRNPGDETDMPRALYGVGYNWLGSDRYVEDASFIRLSSVTVRYNVTQRILKRFNMKSASIYLTGQNLYTWTKYTGQDPDHSSSGSSNPFSYATDGSLTPPSKTFTLGAAVGF